MEQATQFMRNVNFHIFGRYPCLNFMASFNRLLYRWYNLNKRELPWRATRNPYLIWVSEIILQQTRVAQGLPFYIQFTNRFPDIPSLALASEDEVLKTWEGLGYYARARNMHKSAQKIMGDYQGKFPEQYDAIRALPGVGDYTAAAVGSIAFNLPVAAVDGNVARVISRYLGIQQPVDQPAGLKQIREAAVALLGKNDPGLHNQAMMELGALVCTPNLPSCQICPVYETCAAAATNTADKLPVKSKKLQKRERWFTYIVVETPHELLLEKRGAKDIWKGLYQFSLIESANMLSDTEILNHPLVVEWTHGLTAAVIQLSEPILHLLTHQRITARFLHLKISHLPSNIGSGIRANKSELFTFAFPVLIKNYLKKMKLP